MAKKKIDDIYALLDELNDPDFESQLEKIDQVMRENHPSSLSDLVIKITKPYPSAKLKDMTCTGRQNRFIQYLDYFEYPADNNADYMRGFREAIAKYKDEALRNPNNLFIAEGMVKDEIINSRMPNSEDAPYEQGYYDGLNYVQTALKKCKDEMAYYVYTILKRELS